MVSSRRGFKVQGDILSGDALSVMDEHKEVNDDGARDGRVSGEWRIVLSY